MLKKIAQQQKVKTLNIKPIFCKLGKTQNVGHFGKTFGVLTVLRPRKTQQILHWELH